MDGNDVHIIQLKGDEEVRTFLISVIGVFDVVVEGVEG